MKRQRQVPLAIRRLKFIPIGVEGYRERKASRRGTPEVAYLTPAEKFWWGLAGYVLAADVYLWRSQNDTMSIQFGRWLETKQGRALCLLATAGMVAHLWCGLPLPLQTKARRYLGGVRDSRPMEGIPTRNKERIYQ